METIKINPSTKTQLDIDLDIKGVSDPDIRVLFCVENLYDGVGDVYFDCVRGEGNEFVVSLPAMPNLVGLSTVPFRIVVIAEGYYFEPTVGELILVSSPKTKIATDSLSTLPVEPMPISNDPVTHEQQGIVTSQKLAGHDIVPDTPIPPSKVRFGNSEQAIDMTKLESHIPTAFDPSKQAQSIIARTVGKIGRRDGGGKLLKQLRKHYANPEAVAARNQIVLDIIESTKSNHQP